MPFTGMERYSSIQTETRERQSFFSNPDGTTMETHSPQPVDHDELLIQASHEDDEDDDGQDQLAGGQCDVAAKQGGSVAGQDGDIEDLYE